MEHVTALVDHDATPPITCGCGRLVAAGWRVNCAACGRREFAAGELGVTAMAAEYTDAVDVDDDPVYGAGGELETDDEDYLRHRRAVGVEPYDVARDDRLVDEAERRVA